MSAQQQTSTHAKRITADELWKLPEVPGKQFEINEGTLVEVPGATVGHHLIVRMLFRLIDAFVTEHDLGIVFPVGLGFLLQRNPDILRIPDISFVSAQRLTTDIELNSFWEGAPDLVVEVASPHDSATELHDKVLQYLESGTLEVWVVWPNRATISLHSRNFTSRELIRDAVLEDSEVLPGLSIQLATIFEPALQGHVEVSGDENGT